MKYYLYLLRSLKDGQLYTGHTRDVTRRLWRHNAGLVAATRGRRPFELLYSEEHRSKQEAVQRERYLKSLEGSAEKARIVARVCRGGGCSSSG